MELKGYFFTLDAILALTLVSTAIILLSSISITEPPMTQTSFLAEDLMSVLSELKVGEMNSSYVEKLIENGTITQLNNTILEQIGEFYAEGSDATAAEFFYNITSGIISDQNIALYVDDISIYTQGNTPQQALLNSRRMVSGVARTKPVRGYVAKAFLTGLNPLRNYAYYYFGGYVGDGNLTVYISLPNYSKIMEMKMELSVNSSFNLSINGLNSGNYTPSGQNVTTFTVSSSYYSNLKSGENELKFEFPNNLGNIGGGFIRIRFNTSFANITFDYYNGTHSIRTEKLPGINGAINLYSSFYVPGNITSMEFYLHYYSNNSIFASFANNTVFEDNNATGEESVILTDVNFTQLNYIDLSEKTIPMRIALKAAISNISKSGNADVILITDASATMSEQLNNSDDGNTINDCANQSIYKFNTSRISLAKCLDKEFIDIILNNTNNRVGLVRFSNDAPASKSENLTTNATYLKKRINDTYNIETWTCICCALNRAYIILKNQSNSSRNKYIITMSDGIPNHRCNSTTTCSSNYQGTSTTGTLCSFSCWGLDPGDCNNNDCEGASKNANYSSWRAHKDLNATIYSVGFGPVSSCYWGNKTLRDIADSGNGSYYASDNATALENIYRNIASQILVISYATQTVTILGSGSFSSILYPDSYLKLKYKPTMLQTVYGKAPVTIETTAFNNTITTGSFIVPQGTSVADARIISYSGDRWTDLSYINNQNFYNLSRWSSDYTILGDPFIVQIPLSFITTGSNQVRIRTGYSPTNSSGGSVEDKLVYVLLVNQSSAYTSVASYAKGCNWTLKFEDGSNMSLLIPSSYSGNEICDFETAKYNSSDAIDSAVYYAFLKLDLDSNGLLDYNINLDSLSIDSSTIRDVPSLWGPTIVQVRIWH